jgi:4-aminobutyrate aminotransferase-like enzyme
VRRDFGWRAAAIANAVERFKGPDYVYPGYAYAPWTELARLLASLAPRPLTTCFRATGGSEAVDLALQAAMIHTGRRAFLSLEGSYHGNTLGGLSIGATDNREQIKNLLPHCGKVAPPLDAKAWRRIEQRLKRRDVAAFVMEPISINLGVLIPEKDACGYATSAGGTARCSSPMKLHADSAGPVGSSRANTSTATPTCSASRRR